MAENRHGSGVLEFPSALEVVITRQFDAPIQLVFDVHTQPEHMLRTIAPFDEEVIECTIDLRVGGEYHYVFVPNGGDECSFRGTFLEVESPTRTVQTWIFDGWPDVEAVESMDFNEVDGVTTMTYRMVFRSQAERDHFTTFEAHQSNMDNVEDLLASLLAGDDA